MKTNKNISINNNNRLFEGFFTVCEAVSQTMGAQGRLAVMESEFMGTPIVTKDGISTAKQIYFKDKQKNLGAHLAKQVAAKTFVVAGDSTTTSLVLSKALVENTKRTTKKYPWSKAESEFFFNKRVEKGMEYAYREVCQHLEDLSQEIKAEDVLNIAKISANNSEEIGRMVYDAYVAVNGQGIIEVRQNNTQIKSTLDIQKGLKLEKGWMNPFLINNQKNAKFEAENAVVIVYEGYLGADEKVQNILQEHSDRPIIIIAERFHEDTLIKLVEINQRGQLDITVVQAPDFDVKRKAILEDIAAYTGAEAYLQGSDSAIIVGEVEKLIVSEGTTYFIQSEQSERTKQRIEDLKGQLEEVTDKVFIQKRIQNLEGLSATITVGGITESEVKEKFDRFEDSVASVMSAREEGWIAGGGSALCYIAGQMDSYLLDSEEQFGYNVFRETLMAPMTQICINSRRDPKTYLNASKETYGVGYNAYTDELSNLVEDSVIDSTKSIRTALENAKSVCTLLLNTSVVINL